MIYTQLADRANRWSHSLGLFFFGLVVAACFVAFLASVSAQALFLAGLIMLGGLALVVWRWPGWTAVALAALTPVNRFLILLIYHWTHSPQLVQMAQLYKDVLIGLLVVRVLYAAVFEKNPKTIKVLDLLVAAFLVISLLYLFNPGSVDAVGLTARFFGFRGDAYFIVAYFAGRAIALRRQHLRWILLSLIPGSVIVSVVAALQFIFPLAANQFFQSLEFSEFLQGEGSGGTLQQVVRDRGFAGQSLPRASSLLLGDLALAFYQVLLVSLAAALYVERQLRRFQVLLGSFLALMIGTLLLTITRSAAIAIAPAILLIAMFGRGFGKVLIVAMFVVLGGLGLVTAYGIEPTTLSQLTAPEEASVRGHENALQRSLDLIQEAPLGRGFGTAGTVGQRTSGQGITNENWYLQIASEIGIFAGVLYFLCVAVLAVVCFRASFQVKDVWLRVLTLGMGGAAVAFLVVGNLLHAFEVPVLSILFWLLGGIAARAPELETDPVYWQRR